MTSTPNGSGVSCRLALCTTKHRHSNSHSDPKPQTSRARARSAIRNVRATSLDPSGFAQLHETYSPQFDTLARGTGYFAGTPFAAFACAITPEIPTAPLAQRLAKFGVLLLGDYSKRSAQQADRLRALAIPAWTASTEFEIHWLLQRAAVSASLALVDLRHATDRRAAEVARLASLAAEAELPTILVGASNAESSAFRHLVATLPRTATDDDVAATIEALRH